MQTGVAVELITDQLVKLVDQYSTSQVTAIQNNQQPKGNKTLQTVCLYFSF